jgi:hypothetical protein
MPESDLLLQTLARIESKVDASIVNHAERIRATETKIEVLEGINERAETRSLIRMGVTYAGVMLSHLGLTKLGVKI